MTGWKTTSHRMQPVALPHSVADELDMAAFRVGVPLSDAILTAIRIYIELVNRGEIR